MADRGTVGAALARRGVSRRGLLKFVAGLASMMALPPDIVPGFAEGLAKARRQSVIWLSFQECTGCTESLTRAGDPTLEHLIFEVISLDYHHTLMAASGIAAEEARKTAMRENAGKYVVVVDGAVPLGAPGYATIAGISNAEMLRETAAGALAVISVGTCAAFGGIPMARPNPTGAVPVSDIVTDKPVINIPGCPPLPEAMAGTIAYLVAMGRLPELDDRNRPRAFFGETIHDRCYRRPFYERGLFAKRFDDAGARQGWCLYELGCKGPVTYNACATLKWNRGVSFPIQSGHGCLGCSEPGFWDKGGFYRPLPTGTGISGTWIGAAAVAGLAAGAASGAILSSRKQRILQGGG